MYLCPSSNHPPLHLPIHINPFLTYVTTIKIYFKKLKKKTIIRVQCIDIKPLKNPTRRPNLPTCLHEKWALSATSASQLATRNVAPGKVPCACQERPCFTERERVTWAAWALSLSFYTLWTRVVNLTVTGDVYA